MAIKINRVTLYPNPVLPSKQYKLLISIEEYSLGYSFLIDSLDNTIFDADGKKVNVISVNPTDISCKSSYTNLQMDSFVSQVLGE